MHPSNEAKSVLIFPLGSLIFSFPFPGSEGDTFLSIYYTFNAGALISVMSRIFSNSLTLCSLLNAPFGFIFPFWFYSCIWLRKFKRKKRK